jgi:RNA polymerase sigma factor (TIGR02999 family)
MTSSSSESITALLVDWSNGDQAALDRLLPLVYDELRRMARQYMRQEKAGHTLQTTALVHEAYLRLANYKEIRWQERAHFFAVAATLMRRILVEHARSQGRIKRGGEAITISLDAETATWANAALVSKNHVLDMLAFDQAMSALEAFDSRKVKVVEMRLFAEMNNQQIAHVLKVHPNTVGRDWDFAQAWLKRALAP